MTTSVRLLLVFVVPLVTSLILPMQQNNGEPDMTSVINHVALLEQQVEALQTAQQNQIQTSNFNMNTVTTELKVARDKISELENQVSALSHNQGHVTVVPKTTSSAAPSVDECMVEIEALTTSAEANFTHLHDLIMENRNMLENTSKEAVVAFQAVLDQDGITVQKNEFLKFDSTMNLGGAYNKHTGVFTVPTSGLYMFWANVASDNSGNFEIRLVKDGNMLIGGFTGYSVNLGTASLVYVDEFQKGENVAFQNIQVGDKSVLDGYGFSGYGGVLIGQ